MLTYPSELILVRMSAFSIHALFHTNLISRLFLPVSVAFRSSSLCIWKWDFGVISMRSVICSFGTELTSTLFCKFVQNTMGSESVFYARTRSLPSMKTDSVLRRVRFELFCEFSVSSWQVHLSFSSPAIYVYSQPFAIVCFCIYLKKVTLWTNL